MVIYVSIMLFYSIVVLRQSVCVCVPSYLSYEGIVLVFRVRIFILYLRRNIIHASYYLSN